MRMNISKTLAGVFCAAVCLGLAAQARAFDGGQGGALGQLGIVIGSETQTPLAAAAVPQPQEVKLSANPDLRLISATRDLMAAAGKVQTSYMSYTKEVIHEEYGFPHNGLADREREYYKAYEDYRSLMLEIVNLTVTHKTGVAREMSDIEIEIPDLVKNAVMAAGAYCAAVSKASVFDNLDNRNKMYDAEIEMREKQDELIKKIGRLAALAHNVQG